MTKLANATQGSLIKHLVKKPNSNSLENLHSETQSEKLIRKNNIVESGAYELSFAKTETILKNVENTFQ